MSSDSNASRPTSERSIDPSSNLLDLRYTMAWGSEDGFNVWESLDRTAIQFTDPAGRVLYVTARPAQN